MFERVSLRGRVSPNKIPGDLLRLRLMNPCSNKTSIPPCAPAERSRSYRRPNQQQCFVFTIAHLSNDAIRVANASTNPSSSPSDGYLFT